MAKIDIDLGSGENLIPSNPDIQINFEFDFNPEDLTFTKIDDNLIISGYGYNDDNVTLTNFNSASVDLNTDSILLRGSPLLSIKDSKIDININSDGQYEAGAYNEKFIISDDNLNVTLLNINSLKNEILILDGERNPVLVSFARINDSPDVRLMGGGSTVVIKDFFESSMTNLSINDVLINNSQKISVLLSGNIEYESSNYAEEISFADGANVTVSGLTESDIIKLSNPQFTRYYNNTDNDTLTITGAPVPNATATVVISDFFTDNKCDKIYHNSIKSIKTNYTINVILSNQDENDSYLATDYIEKISGSGKVSGLSSVDSLSFAGAVEYKRINTSSALEITNGIDTITVADFFTSGANFKIENSLTGVSTSASDVELNVELDENIPYRATKYVEIIEGNGTVSGLGSNDKIEKDDVTTVTRYYDGSNNDKLTISGENSGDIIVEDFFTTNACKTLNSATISAIDVVLSNSQTYRATDLYAETIKGTGTIIASTLGVNDNIVAGTGVKFKRINNSADVEIVGLGENSTAINIQGFFNLNNYIKVNGALLTSETVIDVEANENYTATEMYTENITATADITLANLAKGVDTITIGGNKTYSRIAGSNALEIKSDNGIDVTISDFFADGLENELKIDNSNTPIDKLNVTLSPLNSYTATKYKEVITGQGSVSGLKAGLDTIDLGENDYTLSRTYDGINNSILKINYNGKVMDITDFFSGGSDITQINGVDIASKPVAVNASLDYIATDGLKEDITAFSNITVSNLKADDTIRVDGAYSYKIDTLNNKNLQIQGENHKVIIKDYFNSEVYADLNSRPTIKDSATTTVNLLDKTLIVSGLSNFNTSDYSMFGSFNITGTAGADLFESGRGNDTLTGNGGDDIFVFNSSSGNDIITDSNGGDVLKFKGITKESLKFSRAANDLIINYGENRLALSGFFDLADRIDTFWAENENGILSEYKISKDAVIDYVLSNNERLEVSSFGFNLNLSISHGTQDAPTKAYIYGLSANDNIKMSGEVELSRIWDGNRNNELLIKDRDNNSTITILDYFENRNGKFNMGSMPKELNVELVNYFNAEPYVADNCFDEIISGVGMVSGLSSNDKLKVNNGLSSVLSRRNAGNLIVSGGNDEITVVDFDFSTAEAGNIIINGVATNSETPINIVLDDGADYVTSAYSDNITVEKSCTILNIIKGKNTLEISSNGDKRFDRASSNNDLTVTKGNVAVVLADFFNNSDDTELGGTDGTTAGMKLNVSLNSAEYSGTRYAEILSLADSVTSAEISGLRADDEIIMTGAVLSRKYDDINYNKLTLTDFNNNKIIINDFFGSGFDNLNGNSIKLNNIIHTTISSTTPENLFSANSDYREYINGSGYVDYSTLTSADSIQVRDAKFYRNNNENVLQIKNTSDDINVIGFDFTSSTLNVCETPILSGQNGITLNVKLSKVNNNFVDYMTTDFNEVITGIGKVSKLSADDNIAIGNSVKYFRKATDSTLEIKGGYNDIFVTDYNFNVNNTVYVNGVCISPDNTIIEVDLNGSDGYSATNYPEIITGSGKVNGLNPNDVIKMESDTSYILTNEGLRIVGGNDILITDNLAGNSENVYVGDNLDDISEKTLSVSGLTNFSGINSGFKNYKITGTTGDDEFSASVKDDIFTGNGGKDTFIFKKGNGADIIVDATSDDAIKFLEYTDFSDIDFLKSGKDLVISYNKSEDKYLDSITIENYFVSSESNVAESEAVKTFMLNNKEYTLSWLKSNVDNEYHMYNVISGTNEANELSGIKGIRNLVQGKGDKDTITASSTGDMLFGDWGADIILSETGSAELYGSYGADKITAKGGRNIVVGGSGGDDITVDGGNNTIMFLNSSEDDIKAFGYDTLAGADKTDILKFSYSDASEGYKFSELRFDRIENNLIISSSTEDKVQITDFFKVSSKIDTILALDYNENTNELEQKEFSILNDAVINVDITGTTKDEPYEPCDGYNELISGDGFIKKINNKVTLAFDNETSYSIASDGLLAITDGETTIKMVDYDHLSNPIEPKVSVNGELDDLSQKTLTVSDLNDFNGEQLTFKELNITGTDSDDILSGGFGDDIIKGNGGNDTFIFGNNIGKDTIDANLGDRIKFSSIQNFDDVAFVQGTGEENSPVTSLFIKYGENVIEVQNYFEDINTVAENAVRLFNINNKDYSLSLLQSDTDGGRKIYNFIEGTENDDELTAIDGIRNYVAGNGGNDNIKGVNKGDILQGDDGDDIITASDNDTVLYGGEGNDKLIGGMGNDKLFGGAGDDELIAGAGNNELTGEDGSDTFIFSLKDYGKNVIKDATSDDIIKFKDIKWSELKFIKDNTSLIIKYGENTLTLADYYVDGGNITKENAINTIYTSDSKKPHYIPNTGILVNRKAYYNKNVDFYEEILGTAKDDKITASSKVNSWVQGNDGNDVIKGSAKYNVLLGNDGNDEIYGGSGVDEIFGGAGADKLFGNNGNDIIIGGDGNDNLTGGNGKDTFIFTLNTNNGLSFGDDTVTDATKDDIIKLCLMEYNDKDISTVKNAGRIVQTPTGDEIVSDIYLRGKRVGDDLIITAKSPNADADLPDVAGTIKLDGFFKKASSKNLDIINLGIDEATEKAINYSILNQMQIDVSVDEDLKYVGSNYNENIEISFGSKLKMGKGKNTVTIKSDYSGNSEITLTSGERTDIYFENAYEIGGLTYAEAKNGKDLEITLANGSNITIKNYIINKINANITIQGNELYTYTTDLFNYDENDVSNKKNTLISTNTSDYIDVSEFVSNGKKGVKINSKAGNDNIAGSYYNDTIRSKYGDNTIKELHGVNVITTGKGNDKIYALENSSNKIISKGGNNTIEIKSTGSNTVKLGAGNDMIYLDKGINNVKAGNGINYVAIGSDMLVSSSINKITTGKNIDTFDVFGGTNTINSGKGNDIINLYDGDNTVKSNGGNNVVTIGKIDTDSNSLKNNIKTGKGSDSFSILNGHNIINSGAGNDKFEIFAGDNNIKGGFGNDKYVFKDGGLNTKVKDSKGNDTYDFSNVSTFDNIVTISDTKGKNTIVLDELKEFYFDVKLNKKGKGIAGNKILFTDLSDSDLSGGIDITGRKAITTIQLTGDEAGEYDLYKFNSKAINQIAQNVAGWLKENGYKSSAEVFAHEKNDGDISDLLTLYTDTVDVYIKK